ncbi:MAG: hypothetical protein WBV71_11930 [Roseobacter sp.]
MIRYNAEELTQNCSAVQPNAVKACSRIWEGSLMASFKVWFFTFVLAMKPVATVAQETGEVVDDALLTTAELENLVAPVALYPDTFIDPDAGRCHKSDGNYQGRPFARCE